MKKEKPVRESKSSGFTVTEVGTILESIRKEIKVVAENHSAFDQRMEKLEVAVHGNSRRLDMLEVRFSVVDGKVTRLEDAVSKLSKDLRETRHSLETKVDGLSERMSAVEANR